MRILVGQEKKIDFEEEAEIYVKVLAVVRVIEFKKSRKVDHFGMTTIMIFLLNYSRKETAIFMEKLQHYNQLFDHSYSV